MSLDAIIICDHDGTRRRVNIPHPPRAYLCLSHWESPLNTRPNKRRVSQWGEWVHLWYRREPDSPIDTLPRYRYYTTTKDQIAPSDEPFEPWESRAQL